MLYSILTQISFLLIVVQSQYNYFYYWTKIFQKIGWWPCPPNHVPIIGLDNYNCVSYRNECLGVKQAQSLVTDAGEVLFCHPNFQPNLSENYAVFQFFAVDPTSSITISHDDNNKTLLHFTKDIQLPNCFIVYKWKLGTQTYFHCLFYSGIYMAGQNMLNDGSLNIVSEDQFNVKRCGLPQCQTCNYTNINQCFTCKDDFYIDEYTTDCSLKLPIKGSLYDYELKEAITCRPGFMYVQQGTSFICQACPYNCVKCDSPTNCLQCTSDTYGNYTAIHKLKTCSQISNCAQYLENKDESIQCLKCNFGYYLVFQNQCQSCGFQTMDGCLLCDSSTECLVCGIAYKLIGGKCQQLDTCSTICSACLIDQTYYCTLCIPGAGFPLQGSCFCEAKYQQFVVDSKCVHCKSGICDTCIDFNECLTCKPKTYRQLDGTKCFCQDGYYDNGDQNYVCSQCHPTCLTCIGGDISSCISCYANQNRKIIKGECACIQGYGESNQQTNDYVCQECYLRCKSCVFANDPYSCTSCFNSQNRQLALTLECQCNDNYGDDGGSLDICYTCHFSCGLCNGGLENDCTFCLDSSHRTLSSDNKCICTKGYFENPSEQITCSSCFYSCLDCQNDSNSDKCIECPSTREPDQVGSIFSCVCKDSNYFDDGVSQQCLQCHYSCLTCSLFGPTFCTGCDTNLRKFQYSSCKCLTRTFDDGISSCQSCYAACLTCLGTEETDCLSCSTDIDLRELQGGSCLCLEGYFEENNSIICSQCSYRCRTCQLQKDYCLSCPANSFRILGNDSSCSCPQGFFDKPEQTECIVCHFKCLTCLGVLENECQSCKPLAFRSLQDNQCYCQSHYFEENVEQCSICSQFCYECTLKYDNCTSCTSDRYLAGNTCQCNSKLNGFSLSTFGMNGQLQCEKCHYSCLLCNGPTSDKCSSCLESENRYLVGSKCLCLIGYFDSDIPQCQKCGYQCQTCIYSENQCLSCQQDSLRILNNQVQACSCNNGYYDDGSNPICQKCDYKCSQCALKFNRCLSCQLDSNRQYNDIIFTCNCISGYYDSGEAICKPCHYSCYECTGPDNKQCQSCKTTNSLSKRFLSLTECVCSIGYYDDGFSSNCQLCDISCLKCINQAYKCTQCSTSRILSNSTCNCRMGYFDKGQIECTKCDKNCLECKFHSTTCTNCDSTLSLVLDSITKTCICQSNSLQIDGKCQVCDSSCLTCSNSVSNCTSCSESRVLTNNQCLCQGGYFNIFGACQICHKSCLTCKDNEKFCLTCSIGNYRQLTNTNACICIDGYYELQTTLSCEKCDDSCLTCYNEKNEMLPIQKSWGQLDRQHRYYQRNRFFDFFCIGLANCQRCPCDECTSQTNCLSCKNNLQLPLCQCDRILNDDWCITCEIAKANIYFSDDLNQIIVYFGYLVAANLLNPFQPSDCQLWFDNSEMFGTNSTCYQSWDRYSVVIQLKPYANVKVGDSLQYKQNFYRDIDQGICDNTFIKTFIENKIYGPKRLLKPYILFTVPSFVSTCKTVEINQILLEGTGQRLQKVLSWQLEQLDNEDAFLQMESFLSQQNDQMKIPIGILSPNITYTISAKYINMFERVNYTVFSFTTLPIQAPYVFLSFNALKANVYVFDCHVTFKDMENQFTIQMNIIDPNNEELIYISQQEQINQIYQISLNESLLPRQQPLLFVAITAFSITQCIKEKFVLESKNIDIKFIQHDRFIGQDSKINARGYDRNILDEIQSTKYINYTWLCVNLFNLQPCKTDENQIIQFPSKRVVDIFADSQNTTLAFFVKAAKDDRWTVKEQFIVVTNFNIEEDFVLNFNQPSNYINPNDEITIIIKNNQTHAFIMQQFKIVFSKKINSSILKFRLADLSLDSKSPVSIYLLPGNESLLFQLNKPPKSVKFDVTPLKGKSLDYFNYTIQNLGEGSKFSIYYYFQNSTLTSDVLLQQTSNGMPLIIDSKQIEGQFQLPSGIGDGQLQLLCVIESDYGAKSFQNQQVDVFQQNDVLSNLVETFKQKTNFSDLKSLHTMVIQMQFEQEQVCLKQCSGVGTCINNKCDCPPQYYFDDCSGNEKQYLNYMDFIAKSITSLVKLDISNNENFKQFSQALLYFSQFNMLIQNLTVEQCEVILSLYTSNLNERLVKINQYSLNLQYQTTQNYNYSEIDIRSLANKNDFQIALNSTQFMWNKTLFSEDSSIYLLQNCMKQFISNIIELSLITLGFEEEIKYELDTAKINIIKTSQFEKYINFSNKSSTRVLIQSENQNMYDIIVSVYLRNFYAYDGYFPYPDQIYPLYDYSIRHSNRLENIILKSSIYYKFKILNIITNLVCLTRNESTYYWTNEYCVLDQIDQVYFCNCSILAPTTIVNDLKYTYQGSPPFLLILPNILLIIYGIQIILVIGVALKANKNYQQNPNFQTSVSQKQNFKYGKVMGLIKRRRLQLFQSYNASIQYESLQGIQQKDQNDDEEQKPTSLKNFWKKHFLLRLALKQLTYLNLIFRSILIITRFNVLLIIAEILELYWNDESILANTCILIGSAIFIRVYSNFIQRQIKQSTMLQEQILLLFQKLFILILSIFTFVAFMYLYFELKDQTNIIISYSTTFLCDLILLDLIAYGSNKFFGEGTKKIIKEKLKLFQKIKSIKQTE